MVDLVPSYKRLLVSIGEMICSSFKGYFVPLYKCLFTNLGIRAAFSDFEVAVIDELKVVPSQLNLGAWAFLKVFQLRVAHKS